MVQFIPDYKKGSNRFGATTLDGYIDMTELMRQVGAGTEVERRLAIINKLLSEQRAKAYDHERSGERFHGAAIIKTTDGRWFLQANIHLKNSELTRDCAEANAAGEARGVEGDKFQIDEIWFMGGKANYDKGEIFTKTNKGQRNSPCGSCLDVIYNNRKHVNGDTVVHLLPLNDGTQKLLPGDPNDPRSENEIEPNRVFSRTIQSLLPNVRYRLSDVDGTQKEMMKKGYEWMQNPGSMIAVGNALGQDQLTYLQRLEQSNVDESRRMLEINKRLMQAAREYYQDAKHKPTSITIAIIRDQNGHYYMGKHSADGKINATPSAEFEAIGAMVNTSSNNRLTDIFIVNFNEKELAELTSNTDPAKCIDVGMPDGATREIIKKFSPRNGEAVRTKDFLGKLMEPSNGHVHVFLPNDPNRLSGFDPKKHIITMSVKELIPLAYKDPKGYEDAALGKA